MQKHIYIIISIILLSFGSFAQKAGTQLGGGDNNIVEMCDSETGEMILVEVAPFADDCCYEFDGTNWVARENCEGVEDCKNKPIVQCKKSKTLYTVIDNTKTRFNWEADYLVTFSDGSTTTITQTPQAGWSQQINHWADIFGTAIDEKCDAYKIGAHCNLLPNGCGGVPPPPTEIQGTIPEMLWRYLQISACSTCPAIVNVEIVEVNGAAIEPARPLVMKFTEGEEIRYDYCHLCGEDGTLYYQGTLDEVLENDLPLCLFECSEEFPEIPATVCSFLVNEEGCDNLGTEDMADDVPVIRICDICDGEILCSFYEEVNGAIEDYNNGEGLIGDFVDCESGDVIGEPEPELEYYPFEVVCDESCNEFLMKCTNEGVKYYDSEGNELIEKCESIKRSCSRALSNINNNVTRVIIAGVSTNVPANWSTMTLAEKETWYLALLPSGYVLDGELICYDAGFTLPTIAFAYGFNLTAIAWQSQVVEVCEIAGVDGELSIKNCTQELEVITQDSCTTSTVVGCIDGQSVLLVIETCKKDTSGLNCGGVDENILFAADDFEGEVGISNMITGWEQLTTADKSGASSNTQATSDVVNATGPSAAGIIGVSDCGDTHLQSLIGGQTTSVFGEGLKKTFTGLTIGDQLCIDFSQAVSNQTNGCSDRGGWNFCLDNDLSTNQQSAETIDAAQETNPTNPNLNWEGRSLCFTITATSHTLVGFPYTTDTDYTCNNWLTRMAIDCVQVYTQSEGGGNSTDCACAEIACITDPSTGTNYDIEDVELVPCGTNDVCFDVEQSSDLVCISVDGNDIYAFAITEKISDCNTGQEIATNNYFTDLLGNNYNATDVTLSVDCTGDITQGQVCVDGQTINVITLDGVTTYYDLGGNQIEEPKEIDYVGACTEPYTAIKYCAVVDGNQVSGLLHVGESGTYFTDSNGRLLSNAIPFCCDDCIQSAGCFDPRLTTATSATLCDGTVIPVQDLVLDGRPNSTQDMAATITSLYGGTGGVPSGTSGSLLCYPSTNRHSIEIVGANVCIESYQLSTGTIEVETFGSCEFETKKAVQFTREYCDSETGKAVVIIDYDNASSSVYFADDINYENPIKEPKLGCCNCEEKAEVKNK